MRIRNIEFALIALLSAYCVYYYHVVGNDWHFVGVLILIVHEAGHLVFKHFGESLYVAGGSIAQVLVPLIAAVNFWRLKRPFTAAVMLLWLSMSLFDMSVYEADAITQMLPLVTVGGDPNDAVNDWTRMLGEAGLLGHVKGIASFINFLGFASIAGGLYVAWHGRIEMPGQRAALE